MMNQNIIESQKPLILLDNNLIVNRHQDRFSLVQIKRNLSKF